MTFYYCMTLGSYVRLLVAAYAKEYFGYSTTF